jgi:pyocin large subunit-like protein
MPSYGRSSFPSTSQQLGTAEQRAANPPRVRVRGERVGKGEVETKATKVPRGRSGTRDHWEQHGHEFPEYRNAREYKKGAIDFCRDPATRRFYCRHQGRPTIGYYNSETNTFAVTSVNGETIYIRIFALRMSSNMCGTFE